MDSDQEDFLPSKLKHKKQSLHSCKFQSVSFNLSAYPSIQDESDQSWSQNESNESVYASDSNSSDQPDSSDAFNDDSGDSDDSVYSDDQKVAKPKRIHPPSKSVKNSKSRSKKIAPKREKMNSCSIVSDAEESFPSEDESDSAAEQALSVQEETEEREEIDVVLFHKSIPEACKIQESHDSPSQDTQSHDSPSHDTQSHDPQSHFPFAEVNFSFDDLQSITDLEKVIFFVKWSHRSYFHCTWEEFSKLKSSQIKGIKKIENYIKNFNSTLLEDPEQLLSTLQDTKESIETFKRVERIVSLNEFGSEGPEFLVKWKGLGYDECTWEKSETINGLAMNEIDAFLNRQSSEKLPGRGKFPSIVGNRGHFKKITIDTEDGSDKTELTLRDYQLEGVNWLAYSWTKNLNVILADEMGLGKTIQSISFISWLFSSKSIYGPFLIVVPLSTIGSWQREIQKWASHLNLVVLNGNSAAKEIIMQYEIFSGQSGKRSTERGIQQTSNLTQSRSKANSLKFNILLTTFEQALKEREFLGSINWALLVVDEAHRLKNCQSQIHETLVGFRAANRLLVTGTPLQNTVKELWSLLNFLMPEKFNSWAEFEQKYATISQESQVSSLHEQLRPHILRRVKRDVEKSLPPKTERILRIDLTPNQQRIYRLILTKNYRELSKGLHGKHASLMNVMNELKKVSNHGLFFESEENDIVSSGNRLKQLLEGSGKMILLDKLLTRLRDSGHRVLIFSQMVKMLDLIDEYVTLKRYPFQRLDGSTGNEARKRSIEHFNAPHSSDFCFLLSTRAGGLGINLETADTVIIFDSDWNPQNDLQAMARAHRIGQRNAVNIYRLVSKGTVEEEILERAKKKMVLDHVIIQRLDTSTGSSAIRRESNFTKEDLQSILQFGAQNLFMAKPGEAQQGTASTTMDCLDLDEILARAEAPDSAVCSGEPSTPSDDFLGQFKVADFGNTAGLLDWSEIVPKQDVEQVETDELIAQEKELFDSMMQRKRKKEAVLDAIKRQDQTGKKAPKAVPKPVVKVKKSTQQTEEPESQKKTVSIDSGELDKSKLHHLIKSCLQFGLQSKRFSLSQQETSITSQLTQVAKDNGEDSTLLLDCKGTFKIPFHPSIWNKRMELLNSLSSLVEPHDSGTTALNSFRLTSAAIKQGQTSKWNVNWGIREDSMLLVGIYLHGFGKWAEIFDDPSLALPKFEWKSEQIARRVEYLLGVLQSPSTTRPTSKGSKRQTKLTDTVNPKQLMKPVREALERISTLEEPVDVKAVCESLSLIGHHIESQVEDRRAELWKFVTLFWPTADASSESLSNLYEKIKQNQSDNIPLTQD